jgi:trimethylamine--corrinoid protein Co-methyltransferase
MVFSNWPLVIDLRSGAFAGGGGETTLLNAASAQLSNWLGLPSGVAASMTDAKGIDAQYGVEKGMTSLAAALAGGNLIYESSGMTAALLGASFEAFILDDDMHAMTYRTLRGVEVTEENLGFDAICGAILGDGHFLGADHTYQAMERDYHYPKFADRTQPQVWADAGATSAWDRANVRAKEMLAEEGPNHLSDAQDLAIKEQFRILPT